MLPTKDRADAHLPLNLWLDGRVHNIKRGRDFAGSCPWFVRALKEAARLRGLQAEARIRGDYIAVRAIRKPAIV